MKRYGLIGYPLGHSFSKKYFTEKFEQETLSDHQYDLFPIASIGEIKNIISSHPDLLGLNVTIPYKQSVLSFLSDASAIPAGLRACNCIDIVDGKLMGYNTDVIGFEKCFMPHIQPFQNKALILGNGGATEAVKYIFQKNKIEYKVVSRSLHDGSDLTYHDLDANIISQYPIIVNTTPLGMYPNIQSCPDIPYTALTQDHYLFDLTYNPTKTLFLQKGEEQGATVQNGAEMLVIQAEESWKIWQAKV